MIKRLEQIAALVQRTLDTFGRVDILINNAGLGLQGDVAELPWPSALQQRFETIGPLPVSRIALKIVHPKDLI